MTTKDNHTDTAVLLMADLSKVEGFWALIHSGPIADHFNGFAGFIDFVADVARYLEFEVSRCADGWDYFDWYLTSELCAGHIFDGLKAGGDLHAAALAAECIAARVREVGLEENANAAARETYTAFCIQANREGTIWIDTVEAVSLVDAEQKAVEKCAAAWEYPVEDVHCLGIAAGNVEILDWND
jgi:hypothetical protein